MTAPIGLATAGPQVELDGVNEDLLRFVASMDRIHQALFARQLVITSARDGQHAPGSLHAAGLAVDIRTADKEDEDNLVLLNVLTYSAHRFPITVFDERNLAGAPHIHIEWHAPAARTA